MSEIDDKVYLVSQAMKIHSTLKFVEDADNETIQKFRTIRSGSLAVKMTIIYLTLTQELIISCVTSIQELTMHPQRGTQLGILAYSLTSFYSFRFTQLL